MVLPDERSKEIGNSFHKYIENSEKSLIESYEKDELERALIHYYRDKNMAFFRAMENRIAELKESESYKRDRRDKLKDRLIGFILGLVTTILLILVKQKFFP